MILDPYQRFFSEAATASAAFAGLLFVALSVVNRDDSQHATRERRTVLAGSAFLALIDIFFVSMVSSFGGSVGLAITSVVMSVVGLAGTAVFMPRAARAGNFARGFPKRNVNFVFATVSAGGYTTQLALALLLLAHTSGGGLVRSLVFVLVALFASALARGWEVAGIGHRAQRPDEASSGLR